MRVNFQEKKSFFADMSVPFKTQTEGKHFSLWSKKYILLHCKKSQMLAIELSIYSIKISKEDVHSALQNNQITCNGSWIK